MLKLNAVKLHQQEVPRTLLATFKSGKAVQVF